MLDKDDGRNKDINRKEKANTLGRISLGFLLQLSVESCYTTV